MKKTSFILAIIIFTLTYSGKSQVQIATVTQGEDTYSIIPRFSIDIGIPINLISPFGPLVIHKGIDEYVDDVEGAKEKLINKGMSKYEIFANKMSQADSIYKKLEDQRLLLLLQYDSATLEGNELFRDGVGYTIDKTLEKNKKIKENRADTVTTLYKMPQGISETNTSSAIRAYKMDDGREQYEIYLETAFLITNSGFAFDDSEFRYAHEAIGVAIPIHFGKVIGKKVYLGVGHYFNFHFYHSEKTYSPNSWKNKKRNSEFFSDRIKIFYPYMSIDLGLSFINLGRFSLRFKYYYTEFFNKNYERQLENGMPEKPYQDLSIAKHFGLTLGYNPGL